MVSYAVLLFHGYMKYIVWLVVLGGAAAAAFACMTAQVPDGEQRTEQFPRQTTGRNHAGI